MATSFHNCGTAEYALLAELIREFRDDLRQAGAKIKLLFAVSDDEFKPAMKAKGQRIAGRAQVNSLQDRAEGKADATICLDGSSWLLRPPPRRKALLHHELSHIGCDDPEKRDALGRPVLHLVHGDGENDGFYEIAKLYGEDAPEVRYLRNVEQQIAQTLLPFGPARDPAESGIVPDAFAALLSAGHTEPQARAAIDRAMATGKVFASVSDLVDEVYQHSLAVHASMPEAHDLSEIVGAEATGPA